MKAAVNPPGPRREGRRVANGAEGESERSRNWQIAYQQCESQRSARSFRNTNITTMRVRI